MDRRGGTGRAVACSMTLIVLGTACGGVSAHGAPPATARASTGANAPEESLTSSTSGAPSSEQRVDLFAHAQGTCRLGHRSGGPVVGSAVIRSNPDGTVSADVTLDGGTPGHEYGLEIVQTPNTDGFQECDRAQATLVADATGRGAAHLGAAAAPGATGAFILFHASDDLGSIDTVNVRLR